MNERSDAIEGAMICAACTGIENTKTCNCREDREVLRRRKVRETKDGGPPKIAIINVIKKIRSKLTKRQ